MNFLKALKVFKKEKWDHSKLKIPKFFTFSIPQFLLLARNVAIFGKAENHAYIIGPCISKSLLPRTTGNRSDAYQGKS